MMIENQKLIAAPGSIVWGVSVDVERWPEWTPTVESVTRLDDIGDLAHASKVLVVQDEQEDRRVLIEHGQGSMPKLTCLGAFSMHVRDFLDLEGTFHGDGLSEALSQHKEILGVLEFLS